MKLTEPVECRAVTEADIPDVELLFRQSSNYLKKHRVDQWQDGYPNADTVRGDIERGEGFVMTYGGRMAGYFCLSARPEKAYDTLTDGKVTLRERDTMKQERVDISQLRNIIEDRVSLTSLLKKN